MEPRPRLGALRREQSQRCQGGTPNEEAGAWGDGSRQLMGRVGQHRGLAAQGEQHSLRDCWVPAHG